MNYVANRWKHLMRTDRKKAMELLPVVRKHTYPARLVSVRLKLA